MEAELTGRTYSLIYMKCSYQALSHSVPCVHLLGSLELSIKPLPSLGFTRAIRLKEDQSRRPALSLTPTQAVVLPASFASTTHDPTPDPRLSEEALRFCALEC